MAVAPVEVPSRPIPALGGRRLSTLSVAPAFDAPAHPLALASAAASLRRCGERGVTTYDLVDVADLGTALACLARAFPRPDSALTVVLPEGWDASKHGSSRDAAAAVPRPRPLLETQELARDGARWLSDVHVLEERASALRAPGPGGSPPHGRSSQDVPGRALGTLIRCSSDEEVQRAVNESPTTLASAEVSLLHRRTGLPALEAPSAAGPQVVARNAFANGRLDGTAWDRGTGPLVRPTLVRELASQYAPVVALGFLARPKERTLAQASVHYLTGRAGIVTVCVPLPNPRRLDELLSYATAPPLTAEEKARIAELDRRAASPGAEGSLK